MLTLVNELDLNINSGLFSLYFYSNWLPYNKKMLVMIDKIEKKFNSVNFIAIDVDAFNGLCKRYNVDSIPTVIVFKDGKEIKRINGLVMTSAFKSAFVDICNS